MTNTKVSELTAIASATADDVLYILDGGSTSNKITFDNLQKSTTVLLRNDAVDEGVGLTLTGDNSTADTAFVPMVLYNTDATPPAASGFPIGTIYIQYTP